LTGLKKLSTFDIGLQSFEHGCFHGGGPLSTS